MPSWVKSAAPAVLVTVVALIAINRLAFLSKVKALVNGTSA